MIETWLAQKAVRIAILVAALLCPLAMIGCTVETVKLHGIAIPAPSGFPLYGPWELVHGAIADRDAAVRAQKSAETQRDLALHDRTVARANQARLQTGLDVCNASVTGLQKTAQAWQEKARKAVAAAAAKGRELDRNRAALRSVPVGDETCPLFDTLLGAALK